MEEIAYHYQTEFSLKGEDLHTDWIIKVGNNFKASIGTLNFIFVSDSELLEMNIKYLQHDYFTDIITFEYSGFQGLSGDLFISVDRVSENAKLQGVPMDEELRRVMVHGFLHLMGHTDKTKEEVTNMRRLEDVALRLFHVKHTPDV